MLSLSYPVSLGIKQRCQNADEGSLLEIQPELSHLNELEQVFLSQCQGVTQVWCLLFLESYTIQGDFPETDTPLFKQRLRSMAKTFKIPDLLVLSCRAQRRLKVEIRALYGRRLWRHLMLKRSNVSNSFFHVDYRQGWAVALSYRKRTRLFCK